MRLPRVRFTVRRMMVAVAVLAAAFAVWMQVDRYQWRRWRQHLNTEMTWSRSPVGQFFVKYDLEEYPANSLLKVSELGTPDREGCYDQRRWWLGRGGELRRLRNFPQLSRHRWRRRPELLARGGAGPGSTDYLEAPSS